jgi:phosphotransacetylase
MLIGKRDQVEAIAHASGLDLEGIEIVDPPAHPSFDECARLHLELMQRRGTTRPEARRRMFSQTRFALMMLRLGLADCLVMGATKA